MLVMGAALIGLLGVIAGGAISVLTPRFTWETERKRLEEERKTALVLADSEHAHALAMAAEETQRGDRTHKRALVAEWRSAVTELHDEFTRQQEAGIFPSISPINRVWFEKLSPHLDRNIEQVGALFLFSRSWSYDTAEALFGEIARIERNWDLV